MLPSEFLRANKEKAGHLHPAMISYAGRVIESDSYAQACCLLDTHTLQARMWPEMARMPLAGEKFPDLAVWHPVSEVLDGSLLAPLSICILGITSLVHGAPPG